MERGQARMIELVGHVREALAAHGPAGQSDRMGLFSVPFRPTEGPLADHVLKPYRSGRDLEVLEPLVRRHVFYLECLERAGLAVPETELVLLEDHGVLRPVIVQRAVPAAHLLSTLMTGSETASALRRLESVATAICGFWTGVAQRPERIGLHASVHNFAIDAEGRVVFLDTFPPLIGLSREDMGRLLLRFSENGLMRGIGALLPGRAREIQDPWYGVTGNLGLLIEGALRLRPADRSAILGWAETFAQDVLPLPDGDRLMQTLSRPRPKLSVGTSMRRFGAGLRPNA
jgi:hypothetical protein